MPKAIRGRVLSFAEFERLWGDSGLTIRDIAKKIGVSPQAVCVRAKVRNLPPRQHLSGNARKNKIDNAKFEAMYFAPVGLDEIAAFFGCHRTSLGKRAEKLGWQRRTHAEKLITMREFREQQLAQALAASAAQTRRIEAVRAKADSLMFPKDRGWGARERRVA